MKQIPLPHFILFCLTLIAIVAMAISVPHGETEIARQAIKLLSGVLP